MFDYLSYGGTWQGLSAADGQVSRMGWVTNSIPADRPVGGPEAGRPRANTHRMHLDRPGACTRVGRPESSTSSRRASRPCTHVRWPVAYTRVGRAEPSNSPSRAGRPLTHGWRAGHLDSPRQAG